LLGMLCDVKDFLEGCRDVILLRTRTYRVGAMANGDATVSATLALARGRARRNGRPRPRPSFHGRLQLLPLFGSGRSSRGRPDLDHFEKPGGPGTATGATRRRSAPDSLGRRNVAVDHYRAQQEHVPLERRPICGRRHAPRRSGETLGRAAAGAATRSPRRAGAPSSWP